MEEIRKPGSSGVVESSAVPGADDDWTGRTLDEFQILRLLGRGGMGQVFLAEQKSLKRKVALKILRPDLAANKTALQRFREEAHAVARLTHANIVQIYAIGEQDGVHYMALEYVEGRNLRDYLNRKGPPDLAIAISIMRQIAAALQRAGEQGFVHRDIKPENILLTRKGEVKVADFGLTRCFGDNGPALNLTQSGVAMGTPLYMSPEQVQGKAVDPRSDIYSFGVTCYHMLAGQPPFRGASAFDVAVQHIQNEPNPLAVVRPDLPAEMCALVHRMMAKKPEDRFENCREILRELSHIREQYATGMTPAANLSMASIDPATLMAHATSNCVELPDAAERRPRSSWLKWVVVSLALAGMAMGGAILRAMVSRAGDAKSGTAGPDAPPTPIVSKEERFAIDAAQFYSDPDFKDLTEVKKALTAQIDLGTLYLKQRRFDDAERFFRSLLDPARSYRAAPQGRPHPYRVFAQLGLALVQGYRDNIKESNARESQAALEKLLAPQQPPGLALRLEQIDWPIEHLELRKLVAEVLNRNAVNLKIDKFARPSLEQLRRPPAAFGKPDRPIRFKDGK